MKRYISLVLFVIMMFSCCTFPANAADEELVSLRMIDYSVVSPIAEASSDSSRATGLIGMYSLELSKTGTTLKILAKTYCIPEVVKCGFKNFVVERKKASGSVWSEYYDYGDLYIESNVAGVETTLAVESGYQYRLSCKHYAKKSLLVTQSVSNTSNIVTV